MEGAEMILIYFIFVVQLENRSFYAILFYPKLELSFKYFDENLLIIMQKKNSHI